MERHPPAAAGQLCPDARSLWADLAEQGSVIGAHDLWLAAACLTHDLRLATANVREFGRVPALVVEDWSGQRSG